MAGSQGGNSPPESQKFLSRLARSLEEIGVRIFGWLNSSWGILGHIHGSRTYQHLGSDRWLLLEETVLRGSAPHWKSGAMATPAAAPKREGSNST